MIGGGRRLAMGLAAVVWTNHDILPHHCQLHPTMRGTLVVR